MHVAATAVLLYRLWPGRRRRAPIAPVVATRPDFHGGASSNSGNANVIAGRTSDEAEAVVDNTSVSVLLATLNEAHRIGPCLEALMQQGPILREIIVIDSASTDGTRELVLAAAKRDPRIRLLTDPPLPPGWIGKVWALQYGLQHATGDWVLGIDADTRPHALLVDSIVTTARREHYDVLSLSPRFVDQTTAERWLQPAMLVSLIYRTGAAGATTPPHRVLANGQCFLAKREVLVANDGYAAAKSSFSDDVTLARSLAQHGARVGFLDGSRLFDVAAYASMREMWREWGRSFDLSDATPVWRRAVDVALVWAVQAAPLVILLAAILLLWGGALPMRGLRANTLEATTVSVLVASSVVAFAMRVTMLWMLRHNYARRGVAYWLSFTADIPAAIRLTLSTVRRPRSWRGRRY